jgi:hypothetical protein
MATITETSVKKATIMLRTTGVVDNQVAEVVGLTLVGVVDAMVWVKMVDMI